MSRILLHACCGPCSLEPTRLLQAEGHTITIGYANSNIQPRAEYDHRLQTLRNWADGERIDVIEGSYDPREWAHRIGPQGEWGEKHRERCRRCYRMRLEEAAQMAVEGGFDALSTTLAVSPYQFTDIIYEELQRAAKAAGIPAVFHDFRPFYPEATRRSRKLGMYRQNFCGCGFSDAEAAAERAERKRQRAAEKERYRIEHADEIAAEEAARAQRRREKAAYDEKQRAKKAARRAAREAARKAEAEQAAG